MKKLHIIFLYYNAIIYLHEAVPEDDVSLKLDEEKQEEGDEESNDDDGKKC